MANSAIVGTWHPANQQITFTFLADGSFLVADGDGRGIEWGQYTWNEGTGAFGYTVAINTDGNSGMSDAQITNMRVVGDQLTITMAKEGTMTADRVVSPANSIVGSWYAANPGGGTDQIVFTFLADGTFLVADKGTVARDPSGTSGVETGTYTWNAATGALSYSIKINTDGQWGLSDSGVKLAKVNADGSLSLDGMPLTKLSISQATTTPPPTTGGSSAGTSGTAGNDTLVGTAGGDTISGLGGNDSLDGGAGIDTAVYAGGRANYTLTPGNGGFVLVDKTGAEGTDTLMHIERVTFSDTRLALDIDGNAGTTAKILGSVFGVSTLANKSFVGIGLSLLDGGMSYQNLMQLAINAKLGAGASNAAVVELLYTNVVGSAPSAETKAAFVAMLDSGAQTQGSLGVLAAETALNQGHVNLVGLAATGIEYL